MSKEWVEEVPIIVKEDWEEDEEVNDDWDASEEEPEIVQAKPIAPKPKKPSKKQTNPQQLQETPQERKERIERDIEARELESAMGLFGISSSQNDDGDGDKIKNTNAKSASLFDTFSPSCDMDTLNKLTGLIKERLSTLHSNPNYMKFTENLLIALVDHEEAPVIRKYANKLGESAQLKIREKQLANRKVAKTKAAPTLKGVSKGSGRFDFAGSRGNDDADPFDL